MYMYDIVHVELSVKHTLTPSLVTQYDSQYDTSSAPQSHIRATPPTTQKQLPGQGACPTYAAVAAATPPPPTPAQPQQQAASVHVSKVPYRLKFSPGENFTNFATCYCW